MLWRLAGYWRAWAESGSARCLLLQAQNQGAAWHAVLVTLRRVAIGSDQDVPTTCRGMGRGPTAMLATSWCPQVQLRLEQDAVTQTR